MSYAYSGDAPGLAGLYHYGGGGLGVLGSAIPSGGTNGGSPLFDDVQASNWAANEVRFRLVSTTLPSLSLFEDGGLYHPPVADGSYTITGIVSVDGVDVGTESITVTVGAISQPALSGSSSWPMYAALGAIRGAVASSALVLWRDFVAQMPLALPDCPVFTVEDAVRQAATRFYRDTRTWREYNTHLCITVAGQSLYDVLPPVDLELTGLPEIFALNLPIDELVPAINGAIPGTDTIPRSWKVGVDGPRTIRVVPTPAVPNVVLTATVAYTLAPTAAGIPWDLYRLHKEPIEDLALSIMMSMKGKPWTDLADANQRMQTYTQWALSSGTQAGAVRTQARLRVRQF